MVSLTVFSLKASSISTNVYISSTMCVSVSTNLEFVMNILFLSASVSTNLGFVINKIIVLL